MNNLLKEEVSQIKFLMGYKKGVVISEQTIDDEGITHERANLLDKIETAIKTTVKINATDEILSNLIGKTLYIYNKPTTCNTSSMKNMIGGKEATTDDTILPFVYTIKEAKIYESNNSFIDMLLEPSKKSFVAKKSEYNRAVDMGFAKKINSKDLEIEIQSVFLEIKWTKEIGWKISNGGGGRSQPVYNECLEKALNEMLPNGLTTIEKEKTDFGYIPGENKNLA